MQSNPDNNFVKFCTTKEHRKNLPFIQEISLKLIEPTFAKIQKKLEEILCSFGKSKLHQGFIERVYNLFRKPIAFL